jgi:uncharacterized phage protein (TIGR01671 family)
MPRQIKFRVWDNELGCFQNYTESKPNFFEEILIHPKGALLIKVGESISFLDESRYILQQFTGLLDKKQKEIYEGDIVSFDGRNYPITWERARWSCPSDASGECDLNDVVKLVEVIGNIFENPELLK